MGNLAIFPSHQINSINFERELLFYDCILIDKVVQKTKLENEKFVEEMLNFIKTENLPTENAENNLRQISQNIKNIDILIESRLVIEADLDIKGALSKSPHLINTVTTECQNIINRIEGNNRDFENHLKNEGLSSFQAIENFHKIQSDGKRLRAEMAARIKQILISDKLKTENVYAIVDSLFTDNSKENKKNNVIRLVLENFPVPCGEISLEQLVEVKQDLDFKERFHELKNWINDMTNSDLSLIEIKEKLEYLIVQYKKRIELHKLKYQKGTLQTITQVVFGALENVAKLNFTKAYDTILSISKSKTEFLEKELDIKGREISYLVKLENL